MPEQLKNLKELPEVFNMCWYWFLRLNRARPAGFGISALSYTEIESFFNLIGVVPDAWEIEIIEMFDSIAMQQNKKQQKRREQRETTKKKK